MTRILHTGDFRACQDHLDHPLLRPPAPRIDLLYLDTTYCRPQYRFPDQQLTIQSAVQTGQRVVCRRQLASDKGLRWLVDEIRNSRKKKSKLDKGQKTLMQWLFKKDFKENTAPAIEPEPMMPFSVELVRQSRILFVVGTYLIGKERVFQSRVKEDVSVV